jgi:integrase
MLSLWRRHLKNCPHRKKGRLCTKCSCPIWCDGEVDGKRLRRALDTRDWARATRKLGEIEDPAGGLRVCAQPGCVELVQRGRCPRHLRTVAAAIAAYDDAHRDASAGTRRSRRTTLETFETFIASHGPRSVDEIDLPMLNAFRASRAVSLRTWIKDLGTIRHFLKFCLRNEWLYRNWAAEVQPPRNIKPSEREPYQPNEVAKILGACDGLGRGSPYERRRGRALVLLLRYTALRISDIATLKKDRVRSGEIFVRTAKNGKAVRLPVPPELQLALDALPRPRGAGADCPYFFWSGNGSADAVISSTRRSLGRIYRASGVFRACSHRFRHTLATEILEMGGTFEEAADVLGDTETTVRKHYAKWSSGRQARISNLSARIWHAKNPSPQVIDEKGAILVY